MLAQLRLTLAHKLIQERQLRIVLLCDDWDGWDYAKPRRLGACEPKPQTPNHKPTHTAARIIRADSTLKMALSCGMLESIGSPLGAQHGFESVYFFVISKSPRRNSSAACTSAA